MNKIKIKVITASSLYSVQKPYIGEVAYAQDTQEVYVYSENGWVQITQEIAEKSNIPLQPRICERCGAPMHSNMCEYCGTEYW